MNISIVKNLAAAPLVTVERVSTVAAMLSSIALPSMVALTSLSNKEAAMHVDVDPEAIKSVEGNEVRYLRSLGPNQTPNVQNWKWSVRFKGKTTGPNSRANAEVRLLSAAFPAGLSLWGRPDHDFETYDLSGEGVVPLNAGAEVALLYTISNSSAVTDEVIFKVHPA